MKKQILPVIIIALMISFCSRSAHNSKSDNEANSQTQKEQTTETQEMKRSFAGPPTIVYKTTKDYSKHVPVTLSEDKERIVSYPGTGDLYYKGEFAYPTPMADGFLLDNKGIDQNVAFLDITYEEYSKLGETPSREELKAMILDDDPLTVMYNCGSRHEFRNLKKELNEIIEKDMLDTCRKLK